MSELGDYMYPYEDNNKNAIRVTQTTNGAVKNLGLFEGQNEDEEEIELNIRIL